MIESSFLLSRNFLLFGFRPRFPQSIIKLCIDIQYHFGMSKSEDIYARFCD